MFLSELLHPISPNKFRDEIYEKRVYWWKAPPGASERFSPLYSWEKFDAYLNDWRNANHIQLADVNKDGQAVPGTGEKWDKGRDENLTKGDVYNLWRHGHSVVLPFVEYQSQTLWTICNTFEKQMPFGPGCANMYCSSKTNSHTFSPHRDDTENFLFHIDGQVKWRFYRKSKKKKDKLVCYQDIILGRGDLLYIPIGVFHDTQPLGPRLTASVHFPKPQKKDLDQSKKVGREKMYDWHKWFEFQREIKL
jgi:hypothetical protein